MRVALDDIAAMARAGSLAMSVAVGFGAIAEMMRAEVTARAGPTSITVDINPQIGARIDAIDEATWCPIAYQAGGEAAVAETTYVTGKGRARRERRLVVRRTRLVDPVQVALWPD